MMTSDGCGDSDSDSGSGDGAACSVLTTLAASPASSPSSSSSRKSRIQAKSRSFIHHTHIALSPVTDANFAAIVRSIECLGGGVIHRIMNNSAATVNETNTKGNKSGGRLGRRRQEINGAEKYVIIRTYPTTQDFLSYIKDWRESRIRPDYCDFYTSDGPLLCGLRLLASHIPRIDYDTPRGSKVHYSDVAQISSLRSNNSRLRRDNSGVELVTTILLFGSEITPIPDALLSAADGTFSIPMHGLSESLNVSNAIAISYYVVRQMVGPGGDGTTGENESVERMLFERSCSRGFVAKTREGLK